MKKLFFLFLTSILVIAGASAQSFTDVQDTFTTFADDLSSALPFASTIGLNWSDSFIGKFPHLGVGVTLGAVGLPADAFGQVLDTLTGGSLGGDMLSFLPSQARDFAETFGMPFPAATIDARLGGFILPFDVGVKVGLIPPQLHLEEKLSSLGMEVNYRLLGADLRLRLIEEKGIIPEVIVGAGMNVLIGGLYYQTQDDINVANFEIPNAADPANPDTYNISLAAPKFGFDWRTTVFDAKAQVSKKLLLGLFNPYLGIGVTMGKSTVSGGAYTDVVATDSFGTPLTQADWDAIAAALAEAGQDVPQLTQDGFTITNSKGGFATRVYGGTSIDLFFIKLDLTGFYELLSKSMGFSVGLRLQF